MCIIKQADFTVHRNQSRLDEGFKEASRFDDVAVELQTGETEVHGGGGLENEGEGEGVGGGAGTEHLAVENQGLIVLPILGKLPQLGVPFATAAAAAIAGLPEARCLEA